MSIARRLIPLILLFHFSLLPSFADDVLYQDAIINGREVERGSRIARSTVLIFSSGGGSTCTGTVISNELVVTAGHCVTKSGSSQLVAPASLFVDFTSFHNGRAPYHRASFVGVRAVRLHPGYRPDLVDKATAPHDVALLRLESPIRRGYTPALFIPRSLKVSSGASVVTAGFGDRSFTESSRDFRLLSFDFTVASASSATSIVLLKASRAGGIGSGDSGGPAFVRLNGTLYFWGVASSSEEEGWAEAAYENLEQYRRWLETSAASMGSGLRLP